MGAMLKALGGLATLNPVTTANARTQGIVDGPATRGDIALYPGGVTWVDSEYDERLGEVLRALGVLKGKLDRLGG